MAKQRDKRVRRRPYPHRRRKQEPGAHGGVSGVVRFNNDGSATLQPLEPGEAEVYIPPAQAAGLEEGERITVELTPRRKGRVHGKVVRRESQTGGQLVGVVEVHEGITMLAPQPEGHWLRIEESDLGEARPGDAVTAFVVESHRGHRLGRAVVSRVLGRARDPRVQVNMTVQALPLPLQFSREVLDEANAAPEVDPQKALRSRKGEPERIDLRGVPHVTIDGEDARDFDDAVSAQPMEGVGFRVFVSIADVSSYVRQGTALGEEARERGTSVYFPHRVIPMLPERLSNDLCSLKPKVPRLTLTCDMVISHRGELLGKAVYPSLIQSSARLTYTQVQGFIEGPKAAGQTRSGLDGMLRVLVQASRAIRQRRLDRGAVDLDIPEVAVILDKQGAAKDMAVRKRSEAHRVIEDLMIAANEAVASTLEERDWSTVYRVHDAPDEERIIAFAEWAHQLGVAVKVEELSQPKGLAKAAARLRKHPGGGAGQTLLLRSMAQAEYSERNMGHFGLASQAYLHFTSPIRRFPDLMVHRSLYRLWRKQKPMRGLQKAALRASQQERRAVSAERDVVALMGAQVARRHLGEEFEAEVVGAMPGGVFVRPRSLFVEGLLPVASFGATLNDYFDYIPSQLLFVGQRTGITLGIGDCVRVRLVSADPRLRRINFSLAAPHVESTRKEGRARARRPEKRPTAQRPVRGKRRRGSEDERSRGDGGKRAPRGQAGSGGREDSAAGSSKMPRGRPGRRSGGRGSSRKSSKGNISPKR